MAIAIVVVMISGHDELHGISSDDKHDDNRDGHEKRIPNVNEKEVSTGHEKEYSTENEKEHSTVHEKEISTGNETEHSTRTFRK